VNPLASVHRLFLDLRQSFESIFEPVEILHGVGKGRAIMETEFRGKIVHWTEPAVDTSTFMLNAAWEMGTRYYDSLAGQIRERKDELIRTLTTDLFDEQTCGFRQMVGEPATVYATHFAFAILKHVVGKSYLKERLGAETASALLGADYVRRAVDFVKRSQDPETGGFVDSPSAVGREQPSVASTHVACFVLWDLEAEGELERSPAEFLMQFCYMPATGAFVGGPEGRQAICSTHSALRCLKLLGEEGLIQSIKSDILNFLERCWYEPHGGFIVSHEFPRTTVMHTIYACNIILDIFHEPGFFDAQRRAKLLRYIADRQSRFAPGSFGWGRKSPPNAYATWNVAAALRLLAAAGFGEFQELYEGTLDGAWRFIERLESSSKPCVLVPGYALKAGDPTRSLRRLVHAFVTTPPKQGFDYSPLFTTKLALGLSCLGLPAFLIWLFVGRIETVTAQSFSHIGLLVWCSAAAVAGIAALESGMWSFRYKRGRG